VRWVSNAKVGEAVRMLSKCKVCHVYDGSVKYDADDKACFGKKGARMVCLDLDSKA
jgi:hypothetical protein